MQEIKVTRCSQCPQYTRSDGNPITEGICMATSNWIGIYNAREIHKDCPIKGETITFKIGENE